MQCHVVLSYQYLEYEAKILTISLKDSHVHVYNYMYMKFFFANCAKVFGQFAATCTYITFQNVGTFTLY